MKEKLKITKLEDIFVKKEKENIWSEISWELWYYQRRIRGFFRDIKDNLHRLKHGWAPSDAWNANDSIPNYIINVLGQFVKDLDREIEIMDSEDLFSDYHKELEKKLNLVKSIKTGFEDYLWFEYEITDLFLCGEMTKIEYRKMKAKVQKNLQKSLKLLGENMSSLWW